MNNLKVLAISGSLRSSSSNTAVLEAAKILAPSEITINIYSGLASLPHFNPDLDREPLPNTVTALRQQIKASDGILISSPEYAYGVPGSLKNALDWLVSSVEFPGKPVALINTNPRATIALASLTEILATMSAKIIIPANLTLAISAKVRRDADSKAGAFAIAGNKLDTDGIISDPKLSASLKQAIAFFAGEIVKL